MAEAVVLIISLRFICIFLYMYLLAVTVINMVSDNSNALLKFRLALVSLWTYILYQCAYAAYSFYLDFRMRLYGESGGALISAILAFVAGIACVYFFGNIMRDDHHGDKTKGGSNST